MYHILPPPPATVPSRYLRTPDGQAGLAGQYFEGDNFDTPKGKFTDPTLDHTWPDPPLADIPAGLASLNHFSVRWQGTLTAPEDGLYELGLEGDDGYRLILDGKTVIDNWSNGAARYRGTEQRLRKGEKLPITIEFFQGDGNRSLRFGWRLPSERSALTAKAPELDLSTQTYLPSGAKWYDFWTNAQFAGGQRVARAAPLDLIPLFVRAGSIVPMGPVVQYATQAPKAPYEVRIYPGADARFTVYEDDNETYDYEKGRFATYDLTWNDRAGTLSIGPRKGAFPGMQRARKLNLVLIGTASAGGVAPAPTTKSVTYAGRAITVPFR
jgi:alpha-D-xyloside xylohydrolase